ncbi:hypothetical protein OG439_27350 [Amycolatopsis sp. NBC_01307]|uniref:hypothetical protein n=1 Tax=Amycolatopsis sp. NBC_01307 TaxID=2903561 RepID=UPI002E107112|nr:hypothetical protein OG439_27350 [Amycolatopsis sp. NBC_01307]
MASLQQLTQAEQEGFARLNRYGVTADPAELARAAEIWRWVAQETSDPGQRSLVWAAISVAMRRYFEATSELWALRDAVECGRAAVRTETVPHRWLSACIYLGYADYTYFKATRERPYLDDALAVLRTACAAEAGIPTRSNVLSHLGAALTVAWETLNKEAFLTEAVTVGREAVRLPGQLQLNSALDLIRNLRSLGGAHQDIGLLRESEALARWAQGTPDDGFRGLALFELARTLDSIAERVNEPGIRADAVAAGEASVALARDPVEHRLRSIVISGIQHRFLRSSPPPEPPLPPT